MFSLFQRQPGCPHDDLLFRSIHDRTEKDIFNQKLVVVGGGGTGYGEFRHRDGPP